MPRSLSRIMGKIGALAASELDRTLAPHFRLTPQVMRRTFACTQLILHSLNLGGMDIRSLQQAMGHASLATTELYLADVADYINTAKTHVNTRDGARLIVELRERPPQDASADDDRVSGETGHRAPAGIA